MAKVIKEVNITIKVVKVGTEVTVTETADFDVKLNEYPDFPGQRRVVVITLTPAQEAAIISHVKNVVLPQAEVAK